MHSLTVTIYLHEFHRLTQSLHYIEPDVCKCMFAYEYDVMHMFKLTVGDVIFLCVCQINTVVYACFHINPLDAVILTSVMFHI